MSYVKIWPPAFQWRLISGESWAWDQPSCLNSVCPVSVFLKKCIYLFEPVNPLANSDETATPWECERCINNTSSPAASTKHTHTHPPLSLSAIAWLLAVTVIKALHYLFMANPKYELKLRKGRCFLFFFPLLSSKGCCIIQQQADCWL